MDKNRVIGVENRLPWHLPADLKRFKSLTTGHHIIMGRKTFESIGKPLPGRTNVIVTRQLGYRVDGCKVVHTLDAALMATRGDEEAFIIGGADIYKQALSYADRIYVTEIDTEIAKGDAHFPKIDLLTWRLQAEEAHEPDEKNQFRYRYLTFAKNA